MTPSGPSKSAETKPNGSRTDIIKRLASQFPRRHYLLAKTQLEIRKVWHTITKDKWQRIADELADILLQNWDKRTREAIRKVIGLIRGPESYSRDELVKTVQQLRSILGPAFAKDVAGPMNEIQMSSYLSGMGQIIEAKPTFKLVDRQAIDWLQNNQVFWVRNYFDRQVKETIAEVGQRAIREGLTRTQAGRAFEDAFADEIDPQSYRYWDGFANHVTTRAREFGRVEGYVRAQITEIEIDAVLDHRTSTICRHMHGRIIQVKDAVSLRDKMMNAKKPEEIIEIAPFMKPQDVLGVSTANLKSQSAGFALPPYHYDCRTRTIRRRKVYDENTVTETEAGSQLLQEDEKELADLTLDEQSNWIQQMRSRSQLHYASKDFDDDWIEHGPDFPDINSKKQYRLEANRNMKAAFRVASKVYDDKDIGRQRQWTFWGPKGMTVVDDGLQIRGFYPHIKEGASLKAFENLKSSYLWLKLKDNS